MNSEILASIKKNECPDSIQLTMKISKAISTALKHNEGLFEKYRRIIIYYDNGQIELTKIISSVFSSLLSEIEFRKVKPVKYKLFQVAYLICTLELMDIKADNNSFTNSEKIFFRVSTRFQEKYL